MKTVKTGKMTKITRMTFRTVIGLSRGTTIKKDNDNSRPILLAKLDYFTMEDISALKGKRDKELRKKLKILKYGFKLNGDYRIGWSQVKTLRDIMDWTIHLLGKPWCTKDMLDVFIHESMAHNGIDIYRG